MMKNHNDRKRFQSSCVHSPNPERLEAFELLRESAKDAPNRAGKVFRIFEFKQLLTTVWIVSMANQISLVEWIILAFCAKSFLLGALRAEQFERFRLGGVTSITFYRDNMDDEGNKHPIRTHCG